MISKLKLRSRFKAYKKNRQLHKQEQIKREKLDELERLRQKYNTLYWECSFTETRKQTYYHLMQQKYKIMYRMVDENLTPERYRQVIKKETEEQKERERIQKEEARRKRLQYHNMLQSYVGVFRRAGCEIIGEHYGIINEGKTDEYHDNIYFAIIDTSKVSKMMIFNETCPSLKLLPKTTLLYISDNLTTWRDGYTITGYSPACRVVPLPDDALYVS